MSWSELQLLFALQSPERAQSITHMQRTADAFFFLSIPLLFFPVLSLPTCPSMPLPNLQIKHSAIKKVALTLSETKESEAGTSRR